MVESRLDKAQPTDPKRWQIGKVAAVVASCISFVVAREAISSCQPDRRTPSRPLTLDAAGVQADRMSAAMTTALRDTGSTELLETYVKQKTRERTLRGEKFDTDAYAMTLGKQLSARGTARLGDWNLRQLQALKTKIALASDRACPCFWDASTCTDADISEGIAKLSYEELTDWARLSAQAMTLEINATDPVRSDENTFFEGLRSILENLPPTNRDRFQQVLDSHNPPKIDQCFAIRTIFSGLETFEPKRRDRFVRAMTIASVPKP